MNKSELAKGVAAEVGLALSLAGLETTGRTWTATC